MKKLDLLNFAKGIEPEPKNIMFVYYHISESNDIVIDDHKLEKNNKGNRADFQFIKEGESDYRPTDEQVKKAWIDWFVDQL